MINVEEWYLKMTENVQRTMDRLTGSFHKAKDVFTGTQERMKAGMDQVADSARQAQAEVDRTGQHVGGLFSRMKAGAGDWLGGLRKGWNEIFGTASTARAQKMAMSAADARKMFKDGKLDTSAAKQVFGDPAAKGGGLMDGAVKKLRTYIDGLLPKGVENAFKAGGMRGVAPLLGRMTAMTGPLVALAGPLAIAGAGMMAFSKAQAALEKFEPAGRELRLANLDKSPAEQQALRGHMLDFSVQNSLDPTEAVNAYISTQRTTGRGGKAVEDYVALVGKAAQAVNQPMQEMVTSTAKALDGFNLPLEKAGELMDNNLKAMAVGGMTYDELSRAQQDYTTAARRTNQTLGSANALYAVMAKYGKDAGGAGLQLAGAMENIGKPKTVKGLKTLGVRVFDARGNMRQMTDVAQDLVPALAKLNDVQYAQLRQQFGGNTGLLALLDTARTSGQGLLDTLQKFNTTDVSMKGQIEAMQNDTDLAAQNVENRMNAAWTRAGEGMKPIFNGLNRIKLWFAEGIADMLNPNAVVEHRANAEVEKFKARVQHIKDMAAPASTGTQEERQRGMADLYRERKTIQIAYDASVANGITSNAKRFKDQLDDNQAAILKATEEWGKMMRPATDTANPQPKPTNDAPDPDNLKAGASAIVGGGKQVRNVNVTIQKLVEKLEVRTAGTVREGISNVRQQVEQALVDIVRGGEAALANG
ncbi:MAG: phage tail tape measure protein [Bacteroidetes bacterium]|nr:phage tail tape measure protein [Bacteroidota bacterium]